MRRDRFAIFLAFCFFAVTMAVQSVGFAAENSLADTQNASVSVAEAISSETKAAENKEAGITELKTNSPEMKEYGAKNILSADKRISAKKLSPWFMFVNADRVVKTVIGGLLLVSALSWIIFIAKLLELRAARKEAEAGLNYIAQAESLNSVIQNFSHKAGKNGAAEKLLFAVASELNASHSAAGAAAENSGAFGALKERIASALSSAVLQARRKMAGGIGFIATLGAVAPFIGLFGTVWGIMNAFIGIGEMQTAGLAAVAPGIAEALLATAIGLFAAIPAVIMYNIFVRLTGSYHHILADIAAMLERLLSRDLDSAATAVLAAAPTKNAAGGKML